MNTKTQQIRAVADHRKGERAAQSEIVGGCFNFRPGLPVSTCSKYGNQIWSWADQSDERLNTYDSYSLTINWPAIQSKYNLNEEIISDLKKYAFLRYSHSREVFWGNLRNGNAHPATVVHEIRNIARFLCHLRCQLSGEGFSLINKLSDIKVEDLSDALSTYTYKQGASLRKILIYLSSPPLGRLLDCGPLQWNHYDIKNLDLNVKKREPYGRIADDLFRFLSNRATNDVKQFLHALGIEPQDKTSLGEGENAFLSAVPDFSQIFEEYVAMLAAYRRRGDRRKAQSDHQSWLHKKDHVVGRVRELVDRARTAAQLLIAMYTGARRSELYSFKVGCLGRDDDGWFISGTLIKQQRLDAATGNDKWVAIPIVRDAVAALEQAARLAESNYLFHTAKRHYSKIGTKYNATGAARQFNKYLRVIDVESRWKNVRLHLHQFRHTLVFQMRRAGLSLPFITFQLKHYYDALEKRVSDTSLGYGGTDSEAATKAVEDANAEAIGQVFHPDAPLAGGGAEQVKARRAAFFTGTALQGHKVDDVIRQLARQGMILMDVGAALCLGQKKIVVDGVKVDPPCIGQLRCNPVRCSNGVIPAYKLPMWERILKENKRSAQDPELAHAVSYYQEAVNEADPVVRFLKSQKRKSARGDS